MSGWAEILGVSVMPAVNLPDFLGPPVFGDMDNYGDMDNFSANGRLDVDLGLPSSATLGPGAPTWAEVLGVGVTPAVGIQGSMTSQRPYFNLPDSLGGPVYGDMRNFSASGRLGVDLGLPNDATLGLGARGNYYSGSMEFPDALRALGLPDKETWNSRGVQLDQLDAFYQTPGGQRFGMEYTPRKPGMSPGVMLRFKTPF